MTAIKITSRLLAFIVLVFFLFTEKTVISQTNFLSKKISISVTNLPLSKTLEQIANAGGFTFSYNSSNFNEDRLVKLSVENKSIKKSLNKLFDNSVKYLVVGSHVILIRKNPSNISYNKSQTNDYIISGYIFDAATGRKIKKATIYEINGKIVSLSNFEGYYTFNIPTNKEFQGLSYSKQGYLDTVIMIEPTYDKNVDIYLNALTFQTQKIKPKSSYLKLNDIHERKIVSFLVPKDVKLISDNLIIQENRLVQISLIPFIGTNRKLSGSVNNSFSFNLFSGYSGGINGIEVGVFLNIVRRNVSGIQLSGFANVVGGDTKYLQVAGFFNKNSGSVTGIQLAGFSNVVLDTVNGIQISGFNNTLHGYMNGIQISGFNNVTTKNVDGFQITGFANVAIGDVNMGQIAGFANYGRSIKGIQFAGFGNISINNVSGGQLAGFFNYSKKVKGFQIAGAINISIKENTGFQLAGLLNYAKKVNGCQIAVFNVSDTVERGLPIGLFSFVRKGFHRIEISSNEVFYFNASYKLGVKRFYNSIRYGNDFSGNLSAGYGIGTQLKLSKRLNVNIDLSSDIFLKRNSNNQFGFLNKLATTIDFNFSKHISMFIGPSYNVSLVAFDDENNLFPNIAPYSFYDKTTSDIQVKMWNGGVFGLSLTL